MSAFFVRRPIVAMVIALVIVIAGLVTMRTLPIAQFPEITPPQIQVSAIYTGADALTVEQAVGTPIEQRMNGVDRMIYMQSVNGSDGTYTLNVYFQVGTDPNVANMLAQNRVNQALPRLPPAVTGYITTDNSGMPIMENPPPNAPFMKQIRNTPAKATRIVAAVNSKGPPPKNHAA